MKAMGYCPSGRLFEAAACGTPLLSDTWEGLEHFFRPGREIVIAQSSEDAVAALDLSDRELQEIAKRGRERALEEHTARHRVKELEAIFEAAITKQNVGGDPRRGEDAAPFAVSET
jgi:spore maturation protein CgeB